LKIGFATCLLNDWEGFLNMSDNDKPKIFIVHGHKNRKRVILEKILKENGFNPIVLSEMATICNSLVEKLEKYSKVIHAFIFYTACDLGREKNEKELKPRARQNVIFEHGYFTAAIGKNHTTILYEKEVDVQTDIKGTDYINIDKKDWKKKLYTTLNYIKDNLPKSKKETKIPTTEDWDRAIKKIDAMWGNQL